jgi:hypothetical protein
MQVVAPQPAGHFPEGHATLLDIFCEQSCLQRERASFARANGALIVVAAGRSRGLV